MSEDRYTQVTEQSWFSRIGDSVKSIVFGLIFFIAAFPLLFWNEGRAVKRYKTLKEGSGIVVSVSADRVDTENEGRLVHTSGRAVTDEILSDEPFGISVNALKLQRIAEMYQWKEDVHTETRKKLGGGTETVTTYSYSKTWDERPIRSESFNRPEAHRNPESMPYSSRTVTAGKITIGAFTLPQSLTGSIGNFSPFISGAETRIPVCIENKARRTENGFYIGNDPVSPRIGDMRITFKTVSPTDISIVAKQIKDTFEPYRTQAGGTVELLRTGICSAEEMFQKAQETNVIITWLLRLAGFILMLIGLKMVFGLLSVIADIVPVMGDIAGVGTGIIAFLISAVLSLITVATAWVIYRPILGILLILAAAGLTLIIRTKLAKAKRLQEISLSGRA